MKRPLRPDETRLWAVITATVRPAHGRGARIKAASMPPLEEALPMIAAPDLAKAPPRFSGRLKPKGPAPRMKGDRPPESSPPDLIEPNRKRRISRERDPLDRRLDLHGLDQDGARVALFGFLKRAQADGERAVLVITGKGMQGDGVLRRRVPEWLAEPVLRGVVAGVSLAERHHGGEGALYVALKRRV
ncbi:MAG: Smr/MutS family protein [Pseudomonadota bacterium]|nr:Smr/MutS family protein [Pseudomonadota bacterium]